MFSRVHTVRCLCLAAWLLAPGSGWATETPAEAKEEVKEEEDTARPLSPDQVDVGDLWRIVRDKPPSESPDAATGGNERRRFVFMAPAIGYRPSHGFTAGVAADVAFYLGDPRTTRLSSMATGLRVSTKQQVLGNIRFAAFSNRDAWLFQGDDRLWWTSQDTYGLGGDTPSADVENVKYDQFRFFQTAYRGVARGLFLGIGLNISDHVDVRPGSGAPTDGEESAYVTYSRQYGFQVERQTSSGPSIALTFDTRDSQVNAQRGTLASVSYRTFFDGFLGGDSNWHEVYLDARTYKAIDKGARHRLAFWFLADLVAYGTAPYFDLPSTGTPERSARGYAEGRYRGDHMVYGEVEYRGALTASGLLGIVAFLNTTTIDNVAAGEKLFKSYAPGGGVGFRVLLNKRSRSNLCADYGWGKDGSRGFYLYIQGAF
jgi:hypothetical protein